MSAETKDKRTYSVEEAAALLGVGRSAAYEACKRGKLGVTVIKVGRRYLIPCEPLERLLTEGNTNKEA